MYKFFKTRKELKAFVKEAQRAWKAEELSSIEGPPVIRVINKDGLILNKDFKFTKGGIPKLFNSAQGAINVINKYGFLKEGIEANVGVC